MINKKTMVSKDASNKKILVERVFEAPVAQVWKAWTDSTLLDLWWAPRPWKAETKSMDFREGGMWLYCMKGPDGTASWCRADYKTIDLHKNYTATDAFCDEEGTPTNDFPSMNWNNDFLEKHGGTLVRVEITFDTEEDMNKVLEMGFQEGFTAAHGNLDELLANQ